jgi:hypothetical protein
VILPSFSHPIPDEQRTRIGEIAGASLSDIRTITMWIDQAQA